MSDLRSGSGERKAPPEECRLSGLILGYPLDHLLNQSVDLNSPDDRQPGIRLPWGELPGTGNIVICGPPGSGKSTLGLQIAVACAKAEENRAVSAYISLESAIGEIRAKARDYGWFGPGDGQAEEWLLEAGHLSNADQFLTPQGHADNLLAMLANPSDALSGRSADPGPLARPRIVQPRVLLSTLTPRDISGSGDEGEEVFWRRYRQLECLLVAARELELIRASDREAVLSRLALAAIELARDAIRVSRPTLSSAASAASREQARARLSRAAGEWLSRAQGLLEVESRAPASVPDDEAVGALAKHAESLAQTLADIGGDPKTEIERMRGDVQRIAPMLLAVGKASLGQVDRTDLRKLEESVERAAQKTVARSEARAILPLVVVDSLNMFGPSSLSRNHVYQLFQLFKRYDRIGVFTVETSDEAFDSTLADVVIRLSDAKDSGYAVRHIEIEKSRYSNCVRGLHPFKSVMWDESRLTPRLPDRFPRRPTRGQLEPARCGIVIFPSLHHVVLKTDSTRGRTEGGQPPGEVEFHSCFGLPGIKTVLPGLYRSQTIKKPDGTPYVRGKVVMFKGARGTFKKNLAVSFLADGLAKNESVLLVRLSDVPLVVLSTEAHQGEESPLLSMGVAGRDFSWGDLRAARDSECWQHIAPPSKVLIRRLVRQGTMPGPNEPAFFEADFKSGHVLPEELVQFVSDILIRCGGQGDDQDGPGRIRRVVFGDVGQVGVSYPFLRSSLTSGDLFLPAFVHLMRNYGVDLVMIGTTSGVLEADAAVDRAATLADAVVSCRAVDVFGASQVVLSGDQAGRPEDSTVLPVLRRTKTDPATADRKVAVKKVDAIPKAAPPRAARKTPRARNEGEAEPGGSDGNRVSARPASKTANEKTAASVLVDCFELDEHYLDGLVAVETGNPHRPGLILQVFEDDPPQTEYNREMEVMLRAALARPRRQEGSPGPLAVDGEGDASDVFMQRFNSTESEAIHDSLDILINKPVNRTVLCTVDEFSKEEAGVFVPLLEQGTESQGGLSRAGLLHDLTGTVYAWPYCCNVLLVAYRQDWFEERCSQKKAGVQSNGLWRPKSWQSIWHALSSLPEPTGLSRVFWYDRKARETLACMLMDALIAAQKWKGSGDGAEGDRLLTSLLLAPRESPGLTKDEIDELVALSRLLGSSRATADFGAAAPTAKMGPEASPSCPPLAPDAMVYVCWYSQLRELIDRVPRLAGQLRICALPGGGFRGDWYVGILRGSVSPELGREVIAKLCRRDEEYKRFALGVGLPVSQAFADRDSNYFAWPGAVDAVSSKAIAPIGDVFDIHKAAWSRSDIDGYRRIRSTLYKVADQLGAIDTERATGQEWAEAFAQEVAGARMFRQIALLADGHAEMPDGPERTRPKGRATATRARR